MKKVLITHAFGPQNRGDHELLQRLIDIIQVAYPNRASIKVFTTYPEESKAAFSGIDFRRSPFYRPSRAGEYFLLVWDLFFWIISSYLSIFKMFLSKERRQRFEEIVDADIIIMCPGGYMYSNGLSFYVNLINGVPFRKATAKKVSAPMSVGPFFSKVDHLFAKMLFKHVDVIHLRESYSVSVIESMGLKPVFTHDLAWWRDDSTAINEDNSWQGYFVGTVIDWDYPDCESKNSCRNRYIDEYLKAAELLYNENSGRPLILYNQVGAGDGNSRDELLIAEIVERSEGKIIFDSSACTPEILRARLIMSKGVLASRFHSALFAIQAETPFIAIAYQPKAEYILKDLALSDYCRSINDFLGVDVASELLQLSLNPEQFRKRLAIAKSQTQSNIDNNFVKTI